MSANYFRGAEPSDGEYASLAAFGIKTVIDHLSVTPEPPICTTGSRPCAP